MLIKKGTAEWTEFVKKVEGIRDKSNRQVLCVKCWRVMNYEQKMKHLKERAEHKAYILTSSKFASEW